MIHYMCYIDEMLDVKVSYSLLALYTCFNPNCKEITATVIHSGTQKAYIYIIYIYIYIYIIYIYIYIYIIYIYIYIYIIYIYTCKDIIIQMQYVHQSIENFIKNFKGLRNVQISIETSGE